MATIEVDFDVFKALTLRRGSEEESYNDVLRNLLGLERVETAPSGHSMSGGNGDWFAKGVRFPKGTEFRARYKGKTYIGRADSGALSLNGERFYSPSAAAVSITGKPVNGWNFWECRMPGRTSWQILNLLRNQSVAMV